ncbi:pentapeptide repeat-containing protein [Streptomyces sp. NPDC057238]|uniref:pentapeptide repeat-containing protein n=1 Tax=Streptomyces sp. NPDC057238 TaxID=3346060 RepID=UPI003635E0C9
MYLAGLAPGADLDHRGTPFTRNLLNELLGTLSDPATGRHRLGRVRLDEARFNGDARFAEMDFTGDCSFGGARFDGGADFGGTVFEGDFGFGDAITARDAWFDDVEIRGTAWFHRARVDGDLGFSGVRISRSAVFRGLGVGGDAMFSRTEFHGPAVFSEADITGRAWFDGTLFKKDSQFDKARLARTAWFDVAEFEGEAGFDSTVTGEDVSFLGTRFARGAWFPGATFGGDVEFGANEIRGDVTFRKATFLRTAVLGPLVFPGLLDLSDAEFQSAVTIEAAAKTVRCRRTRWGSAAALRIRHADVDVSDAVLQFPVSVAGRSRPFVADGEEVPEQGLSDPRVRVTSLRGADAAYLVLTDVDLTGCLFVETVHLDQLKLDGRCPLASTPSGVRRVGRRPVRWTRRRTLAEEHHWRADRQGAEGWTGAPDGTDVWEPAVLAPVYRQLRKALEDNKDEPGAADFYYGEMEMRRHDRDSSPGERALLTLYWAVSGYGLRAVRALGWLLLAVVATVLAMMLWGLPQDAPEPVSTGKVADGRITMTTDKPDPVNPRGSYGSRLSTERFEKSLRVVINSVVFRSSGQELTTAGTYVEMTSRVVEPALLGLAALAVRSRVKR